MDRERRAALLKFNPPETQIKNLVFPTLKKVLSRKPEGISKTPRMHHGLTQATTGIAAP